MKGRHAFDPAMLAAFALAAAAPRFDPIAFFAGRTAGVGRLKVAMRRAQAVQVAGVGSPGADGGIVLEQRVTQAGRPPRMRNWVLHPVSPGHYAGTLSDAHGPVMVESVGERLHIAYRAGGKVRIEQWLTLARDGRTAANRLTARRFGVTIARLDETIRKLD